MKNYLLTLLFGYVSLLNYAQNLYDIDNITLVEIEFSETNWDDIMDQYYMNDIDERLTTSSFKINGISYDSVGVKFKGNSSYSPSNQKNPLNIKLNYKLDQTYQNYKTLKLSNGFRDPAFVKEVLAYEIGRKYMDLPLSNYAKVYINGNFYGLFASNEAINGDYLERRFYANRNNVRVKCNATDVGTYGVSPSLEYLGADSALYENGYELKSDIGWYDLVDLCNELSSVTNVESVLDVDRALWMLAFNNVLLSLDSYTGAPKQNYYLVKDDNGRFLPVIWDLNGCFAGFTMLNLGPPMPPTITDYTEMNIYMRIGDGGYPLISKLLSVDRYKKIYIAHCKTILNENLSNNSYYNRALELQSIITTEVQNEPNGFYTHSDFITAINSTVGFGIGSIYGIHQILDARKSYLEVDPAILASQPIISSINSTSYSPNTTTTITANIVDANYAYFGYREYQGDVFTKIEMFDDGLHNDGAAGDNIFGVDFSLNSSDIQYYIYAENSNAGILSPVRAEHEFYDLILDNEVVINEVMTKNNATVADQDGEFNDWVELYNKSATSINLTGYYLSDDITNPTKWFFPSVNISPNSYLIVWLDKDTLQSGLHTNFKLESNGDILFLSNASGQIISTVQIPLLESSTTFGRYPNGTGNFIRMIPTHNAQNSYTALAIEENISVKNIESEIVVYPNPVQNVLNFNSSSTSKVDYLLFNNLCSVIDQGSFFDNHKIDVSNLSPGLYFVSFNGSNQVEKIIIQ